MKEMQRRTSTIFEPRVPFQLNLMLPRRIPVPVRILNISYEGALMVFPEEKCPDLEKGERIRLVLTVIKDQVTSSIDAVVKGLKAENNLRICSVEFINPSGLVEGLDPTVLPYFNRRQSYRVKPDQTSPIGLTLQWEQGAGKGWILDISTTGMALGLEPETAERMGRPEMLELCFSLPGEQRHLTICGIYRYKRPAGNCIHLGIEFDWIKTRNALLQEKSVYKYVLRRQKARIRRG